MTIAHRTLLGEDGEPEAAVIPWEAFLELRELVGKEPSAETREAMEEALDGFPGRPRLDGPSEVLEHADA